MQDVAGLFVQRRERVTTTLLVFKGGHWFFPGGKREKEESLLETLVRELQEELRLAVRGIPTWLHTGTFKAPQGKEYCYHTFFCKEEWLEGSCVLNPRDSVKAFAWVDDPLGLNLTPHTRFILESFVV